MAAAHDEFRGILNEDFIADVVGEEKFAVAAKLELANLALRDIRMSGETAFIALHTLNLEGNKLSHFAALSSLPALRALCLNSNRVRSLCVAPLQCLDPSAGVPVVGTQSHLSGHPCHRPR